VAEGPNERDGRPDGSVGADVRDPLKVAAPGWPLCGAVEYGVFQGFWGLVASGAGCRDVIVVPGGVSAEVALARPQLVQAARSEFVEAYEWMGLERGAVRVPGRVRRGVFTFFHEEAPTLELQLVVGAARGRGWVVFAKKVLGGHRKGFEPAGA